MRSTRMLLILAVLLFALQAVIGCKGKASVAEQMVTAERHLKAGDYESAEIGYLNVLKEEPKNLVAMAKLGIISQQQGQLAKALAILQRTKTNDLNNVEVRRSLAFVYVTLHQLDKAREESEFVLQKVPDDSDAVFVLVDASREPAEMESTRQRIESLLRSSGEKSQYYVGLGELALRRRDLNLANDLLSKAVSLDPKSGPALSALANLNFARTNIAEGERLLKSAAQLSPPRSFVRLKWADFKNGIGQVDEAREFLEATLKEAPGYVPVLTRLARIAFDQKKHDECSALVRRLLTSDPVSFEGRLLSARLNAAQGQPAKALEELERMATMYPRAPLIYYELALAHLEANSIDKCIENLNKAVSLDPGYSEAVLLWADLNARRRDYIPAVTALTELVKRRPQFAPAQYALASAYRLSDTPDKAVPIYQRLMQLNPRDPNAPYSLGLALRQQEKMAEARQAFEKAHQLDPKSFRVVRELVNLDLESRQFSNGLQRLERQIALTPTNAEPYFVRAQVHLANRNNDLAEKSFLKALEVNPDFTQAYVALAQMMVASGRQQQALERLESLLARNSKDISVLMLSGMIHEQMTNYSKARDAYERVLAINPKSGRALNNAAHVYANRLGQLNKGLELARRAREQAPTDPYVADTLGWILYQTGDYPTALAMLQESARNVTAEAPLAEVRYHVGMTHYMLGDETQARATLESAVRTTNSYPGKAEAEQSLALLSIDPAKSGPKEIALLDQRLAQQPGDPVAALRRATIHSRNGEPDKAIALCEKALKGRPGAVRLVVQLAELYSDAKKDREQALEYSRQARKLAPEDPQVAYAVGRVAFQNRDYKWASSVLSDAARKRPDVPDFLTLAGMAAYSIGQITEAEAFLQRASSLASSTLQTNTIRHLLEFNALLREPSRIPGAQEKIDQALKSNPNDVPALMASGLSHEQKRNWTEADKAYSRVLTVYPEFIPAMKSLARVYVEQDSNTPRAFELASKARETLSTDSELMGIMGIISYRRGDYAQASRLLQDATRTRTNDATLYYHLGMARHRLKEKEPARTALNRALQLNATGAFAAEAKKALAELDAK